MWPCQVLILMLTLASVQGQQGRQKIEVMKIVLKCLENQKLCTFTDPDECPDAELGDWSDPDPCDVTCGGGYQLLTREVASTSSTAEERWWDKEGCELQKVEECNPQACPTTQGMVVFE